MGGREARTSVTSPLTLLCFAAPGLANVWSHRREDQMEVWIPQRVNLDLRIP